MFFAWNWCFVGFFTMAASLGAFKVVVKCALRGLLAGGVPIVDGGISLERIYIPPNPGQFRGVPVTAGF
jgi:hypothetical protein